MTTLRTVAKAHCPQNTRSTNSKVVTILPKQLSHLSAILAANAFASKIAMADDALSVPDLNLPDVGVPDITLPSVDSSALTDLFADNPVLIGGIALLVALPLGISAIFNAGENAGKGVKPTSVENTLQALENDERVILLDVRSRAEAKAQGRPDLRSVKGSTTTVPFTTMVKGETRVDEKFEEKVARIRGLSEESLVIILDADGSVAKAAARAIAGSVAKTYYVQGGAEAWAEMGPWRAPSAGIKLPDLRSLGSSVNNLAEDFKKAPTFGKAGIAAAAIAGAGLFIFNEAEVVLEAAGVIAGANILFRLLFNEPKAEVKKLVDEKIGVKEVAADLSKIADAVVEESTAVAKKAEDKEEEEREAAANETSSQATASSESTAGTSEQPPAKEWIENWKAKSNA